MEGHVWRDMYGGTCMKGHIWRDMYMCKSEVNIYSS